jgi:hypothetical protein
VQKEMYMFGHHYVRVDGDAVPDADLLKCILEEVSKVGAAQ